MIRNEGDYQRALQSLGMERNRSSEARMALQRQGLSTADVDRLMAPRDAHEEQLVKEMKAYVTLQRGSFGMTPGA
jgi:hypothetical protein